MAKGKMGGSGRPVGRRGISRRQWERRIQRLVFAIGIFVIVLVLGLMGTGWYLTQIKPFSDIAFNINGTEINMRFYVDKLVVSGPSGIEDYIKQYELERQAALKLGISVSNEEARAAVEEDLTKNDIPVTDRYVATLKYKALVKKLQDEYFEEQAPVAATQRELLAIFLESESVANDIRNRILAGEDFGELAGKYSLDTKTKESRGNIGWHPKGTLSAVVASSVLDEVAFSVGVGAVSEAVVDANKSKLVSYWLFNVLEKVEDEARVQIMVLSSEEEAQNIRARVVAGEDFVTLAKEFSQVPGAQSDGGDIGLIKKGERGTFYDEHVFNPNVTAPSLSQPVYDEISSKGGCWLVKAVAEANDKVISNEDRETLKLRAYYDWANALWNDPANKIENYLTENMRTWAMETARREQRAITARAKQKASGS